MNDAAKKIVLFSLVVLVLLVVVGGVFGGSKKTLQPIQRDQYTVQVTQSTVAADGLNLQAVGALVKDAKDAEDLERKINESEINNMDLNLDGNVDYIKVYEYGEGDNRGFSLYTEFEAGEEQEIATIDIAKTGSEEVEVEVHGNEQIYGRNYYHRSHFGIGDMIFMSWLYSSRSPYHSPWGYQRYPGYYSSYRTVSPAAYQQRIGGRASSSGFNSAQSSNIASKATSPNAGKSSGKVKASLKNPTASQKSFQARSSTTPARSGGFGKRTTASTSRSSPSVRGSSGGRSGGSRGGK
jgi:hypothetical protein